MYLEKPKRLIIWNGGSNMQETYKIRNFSSISIFDNLRDPPIYLQY